MLKSNETITAKNFNKMLPQNSKVYSGENKKLAVKYHQVECIKQMKCQNNSLVIQNARSLNTNSLDRKIFYRLRWLTMSLGKMSYVK